MIQFDSGSINKVQETPEGFLKLTGTIASVGWLEYRDNKNNVIKQFVPKETLFDSEHTDSISGSILTMEHPKGLVDSSNYNKYTVGTINSIIQDSEEYLNASMTIYSSQAIKAIKSKKTTGLSMGYRCTLRAEDNNTFTQVKRICNHIAITTDPRCKVARLHLDSNTLVMVTDPKPDYRVFYFS